MSENVLQSQEIPGCWVGVDWGEYEHAVSVVGDDRKLLKQFVVSASTAGLDQLGAELDALGTVAGIAVEATSNLVLTYLLSRQVPVYAVNPKLSKNWREGCSVAGVKSDARDGHVLSMELARRHESLRPMRQSAADVAELASLCETVRDLVDERTALMQKLKATLRQYYPAALQFFTNWGSPVSWRFLKKFPQPEKLARTRKETLYRFLKSNRVGLSPKWVERVEQACHATAWPLPQNSVALEVRMLSIVAQLSALEPHIDKCDELIAQCTQKRPEAVLMESLPGTGPRLAPALTAIAALVAGEPDSFCAMRCLSGVAPVENSSGKRSRTNIRRRCNKHWRNVFHLFARMSVQHCAWARTFYDLCRERGDRFATALRKLADKWLKIIHRMLATNELYDDERYVESLRKSNSPVYARMCGKAGG